MLERLTIKNYALIESLEIEFHEGLSIITGETGAGKSVMMGALGMLMGDRADTKITSGRDVKATVEASFDMVDPRLEEVFRHLDLDWNDGCVIVRREISPSGRSRAFVNDTPVTLQTLSEISRELVDVHSQNSNRLLALPEHQLWILDSICGNEELLGRYRAEFRKYVNLRSRLRKQKENIEKTRENREFLMFQLEQLDALNPKRGELAEIEERFERLSNADEIRGKLSGALSELTGNGEEGAVSQVARARHLLDSYPELQERLNEVEIELNDMAECLESELSKIETDPVALTKLSSRMNELYEAEKRFRVTGDDGLVELHESLKEQLADADREEDLSAFEAEAKESAATLRRLADELTGLRANGAVRFASILTAQARTLGLKNLNFEVRIDKGKIGSDGQDKVEFYCAFNKNQQPMPLTKVASGGEMSRLTLCIRRIIAGKLKLPTVVFDEIDTGVSGEIADKMGRMMVEIASDIQVIAITHLPQVAARGHNHMMVYKKDLKDRTVSNVMELNPEQRVREIARMLSGSELNNAAIENARVLLAE